MADPSRRITAGLCLLLVCLSLLAAGLLAAGVTDPHGLSAASPVGTSDVARLTPLYGAGQTGTATLDWSPDGRFLAVGGGEPTSVVVLDAWTGGVVTVLTPQADTNGGSLLAGIGVFVVRWSPDGTRIAVAGAAGFPGPGWTWVFDTRGNLLLKWEAHPIFVSGLAWSPDSRRIATSGGSSSAVWDAATGQAIWYVANASARDTAAWSPDGSLIAYGGGTIRDAATGALQAANCSAVTDPSLVAWSHDSSRLALTGRLDRLAVCTRDGGVLGDWPLGPYGAGPQWNGPSWNPGDTMIAVGVSDGIHVARADTGSVVGVLSFPVAGYGTNYYLETRGPGQSQDEAVAWSPMGNAIASTGTMTTPSLRVWGVEHRTLAVWAVGFEAATLVGIPVALGREQASLLFGYSGRFRSRAREGTALAFATPLLAFVFAGALMQSLSLEAFSRVYSARIVPDAAWWLLTLLISAGDGTLAVVVTVFTFRDATWHPKTGQERVSPRTAARFLGLGLVPVLWTSSLGLLVLTGLTLSGVTVDPDLWGVGVAAFGSAGLLLGSLTISRVAGPSIDRAIWGLLSSAAVAALLVVAVPLVTLTLLSPILGPNPSLAVTGLTVVIGFGLTPLVLALAFVAIAGSSTVLLAYPPKALLFIYTRLTRREVLDLGSRQRILAYLVSHPGVHFRQMLRDLEIGSGSLSYHLYVLEREGFVRPRRDGMYRRFFLTGQPAAPTQA